ncbi:MAG TPA: hypothetical protein VLB79_11330 [Solirubrobacterales bacterium]|nr:hypothetical protein [Solirubrobacterales bacterium]
MTAALIAIGVIAFLAVDAYVIYRVFKSRASADDYGRFMVPGEAAVTLPAGGRLKISYQEEYVAPSSENSIEFYVPRELQIEVTGPSGAPLEIKGPGFRGMGRSAGTGRGWSRTLVGTVEVTEPGDYTVTAGPAVDGVEPKILLGK